MMTSKERVRAAINLQKPDRVPVAPLLEWYIPFQAGITTKEFIFDFDKACNAIIQVWEKHGKDIDYIVTFPYKFLHYLPFPTSHSVLFFNWIIPDGNELPQFREYPPIMKFEDYDRVMEKGWVELLRDVSVQHVLEPLQEIKKLREINLEWQEVRKVQPLAACYVMPPAELLSFARGFQEFTIDLYRHKKKILEFGEFMIRGTIDWAVCACEAVGVDIAFIYGGRISASFLSPRLFEEVCWPHLKQLVDGLAEKNIISLLHFDGDWEPMYPYLKELPQGKCILELEKSDIYKAKEMLGDRMCIMGNVDSTILRYGTPEDVKRECKKLIEICGEGGGFILSSGCEVPLDTPFENVQAMIEAAKEYGVY
ncbi:Uroporphyrinogen-III decarboxylase [Thermanaeromonas toyohensis ToBE]|uniref:Uroporphyrinogen-III decarboxylase n=1 Tax=Thermanaeromonas toyohensis ToBE TaxID=698762 RepID=A0A1W1VNQ9_9FIRM|nr:uroporphyrinogen decarboxylase family protein [Thermanaeromonas toyohensis]SMB94956.1 Uroporphyrinogen-III decarboxylase [Thermanaeromonas toyohensis ToBE]